MWRLIAAGGIAAGLSLARRTIWPYLRPTVKGYLGEAKVRRILNGFHKPDHAKAHDLLIHGGRDTTQIDHVLVSRHGIFVIETKNYSGDILGSETSNVWKQVFKGQRGTPQTFLNPLIQNKTHINALRALLRNYPKIPYYSIVAFSNSAKLQPIPNVVKMRNLKLAIEARCNLAPVLTCEQVKEISSILQQANIKSRKARRQHNAKAQLASSAARNITPQTLEDLEKQAQNAPWLSLGERVSNQPSLSESELRSFTDSGAQLTIRGRTASIEDFFEGAKRDLHGKKVDKGSPFDHFICPYTGDPFPKEEAKHLYEGLWVAYLSKNPELVDYLRDHISENPGNNFRCQRVLSSYIKDPDGFTAQARDNNWYRNIAGKKSKHHKPLQDQIQNAERSCSAKAVSDRDTSTTIHR